MADRPRRMLEPEKVELMKQLGYLRGSPEAPLPELVDKLRRHFQWEATAFEPAAGDIDLATDRAIVARAFSALATASETPPEPRAKVASEAMAAFDRILEWKLGGRDAEG